MKLINLLNPKSVNTMKQLVSETMADLTNDEDLQAYIECGLAAELGELYDLTGKSMRRGYDVSDLDWVKELGDVIYWYMAADLYLPESDSLTEMSENILIIGVDLVINGLSDMVNHFEAIELGVLSVVKKLNERKARTGSFVKRHDEPT